MSLLELMPDPTALKPALGITACLLLLLMARIIVLMRAHSRLQESTIRMEKLVHARMQEIIAVRQDSSAWRAEMQCIFDAYRGELSKRLSETEQRRQEMQGRQQEIKDTAPAPAALNESLPPVPAFPLS